MRKQEKILEATLELVTELGFHGTTTALIAKKANVGSGTIYRYYASKEDLLNALFTIAKDKLKQSILANFNSQLSSEDAFHLLMNNVIDFYQSNPLWFSFMEQYRYSPFISTETKSELNEVMAPVLDLLQGALDKGDIKALPPKMLLSMFHGVIIGLIKGSNSGFIELDYNHRRMAISVCWDGIKK
ncbi:TetR/AcrR family transcriptional regulator [Rapidithrix thailandica]|uniref:TetR/AcrR family transcriptional regulator n=1 Tax=Rapidithrix thailandica TaxID=413964 RepID=A0AAW9S6S5_9BACT